MNQISIISDLILWIEKNLEQPLSIDDVAQKSGYSKWHLQRMFKSVTGQVLGSYIRHRRLTYSALALRMTSKPILDIAMQYRFDSQQTFTRSFKKQFFVTPANYRRNEFWDLTGLMPAIKLDKSELSLPEPTVIHFQPQTFWGITYKNHYNFNLSLDERNQLRKKFFDNYLSKHENKSEALPDKIYSFTHIEKSKHNKEEQEIFYTLALAHNNHIENIEPYPIKGGDYLCFKYTGSQEDFRDFISQIYLAAMPKLKVKLRPVDIITIHYNRNNMTVNAAKNIEIIECDYCVPVIIESKNQTSD